MSLSTAFFEIRSGATRTLDITITDDAGAVVNISSYSAATFKIAADESTAALVSYTKDTGISIPGGGTDGVLRIAFTAVDSATLAGGHYYFECTVTLSTAVTYPVTGMIWVRPKLA